MLRYRGSRGGEFKQRPIRCLLTSVTELPVARRSRIRIPSAALTALSFGATHGWNPLTLHSYPQQRPIRPPSTLKVVTRQPSPQHCATSAPNGSAAPPFLYVFNACSIAKPHALDHLASEFIGYSIEVAVIVETHLKKNTSRVPRRLMGTFLSGGIEGGGEVGGLQSTSRVAYKPLNARQFQGTMRTMNCCGYTLWCTALVL